MNGRTPTPRPDWLQKLFPWPQRSVLVNGRNMAYVEAGPTDGRPVLLLPGNPTWGFLYRDFIAPLAEAGYRPIALDWIGSGYSDHPRVERRPDLSRTTLPTSSHSSTRSTSAGL